MTEKNKLNLGCCDVIREDYINLDIVPGPGVDIVHDLSVAPWPIESHTMTEVHAYDIIEHLPNKIQTMNEIYRVLVPGGIADILVPTTDGRGAYQDPTHVSYWNRNSFWYFTFQNHHHTRFRKHYGIQCAFIVKHSEESYDEKNKIAVLHIKLEAFKPKPGTRYAQFVY